MQGRRTPICVVFLACVAMSGIALAQRTNDNKANKNHDDAAALRKAAEHDAGEGRIHDQRAREAQKRADDFKQDAATQRSKAADATKANQAQIATVLNQNAQRDDAAARQYQDVASKEKAQASQFLASARSEWQKAQALEKAPCPGNAEYCSDNESKRGR